MTRIRNGCSCAFLITVCITSVVFFMYTHKIQSPSSSFSQKITSSYNSLVVSRPAQRPLIMFWNELFYPTEQFIEMGQMEISYCANKCDFTSNRSLSNRSAATIFHVASMKLDDLPKYRSDDQRYVFFLLESPSNSQFWSVNLNDRSFPSKFFNLTMTYRRDSDVYTPYWQLVPKTRTDFYPGFVPEPFLDIDLEKLHAGKSKMAAQFVSNCKTPSKREALSSKLAKYLDISIFGSCGNMSCPRRPGDNNYLLPQIDDTDNTSCFSVLSRDFFFYLAFENSVCKDYVTEKFWNAIRGATVPVVLRQEDYVNIAPVGSYIAVDQFSSVALLAQHLLDVAGNTTKYMEYFKWRNKYWKSFHRYAGVFPFCDLCNLLHNKEYPEKTYDPYQWWIAEGQCVPNFAQSFQ